MTKLDKHGQKLATGRRFQCSWGLIGLVAGSCALLGCSDEQIGLGAALPADTTVNMDFFHKPLPEIPLPNDIATRFDPSAATGRRINASIITPTQFESTTRARIDKLDGWGVLQPISIPFTGPIDITSVIERHDDADYATADDAVYLINIDTDSPRYGELQHLDIGNGNFPAVHERPHIYGPNDPRGWTLSLTFEEADEDTNGNGVLDPGEDTDADGLLDVPNYRPGANPALDDLAGRADALMTFYERSTNTLIAKPLLPLDDRTRYAVVVTRRILDMDGEPVGSPYPSFHHLSQTEDLRPLLDVMPDGLAPQDIAYTFSYTTQTIRANWQAVRDGLYGIGPQAHIGNDFPARVKSIEPMRDESKFPNSKKRHLMYSEHWRPVLEQVTKQLLGEDDGALLTALLEGTRNVDFYSVGSYVSPQLFPRNDGSGNPLPYNDQAWPEDLHSKAAPVRGEDVIYSLSIPRKEVSARGENKQVPIIILGHGYTGNRFDVMQFSSYMAQFGMAVVGIDGPSHGISISPGEATLARAVFSGYGLSAAGDALLRDRALDHTGDGLTDSGADFWTSYMFHTRDMVRQFALDYMQLVKLIRSFDGKRTWAFDVNGDGEFDLAGDYDGDGHVDIGSESEIYVFGGSLGGIMSMILGAVEPEITAIAPISGGGGYGEMGIRSTQGGVHQGFILRVMGPLFHGATDENGNMLLTTQVVTVNDDETLPLGSVTGIAPGDTMVVENLRNGERGCGYVAAEGTVRAAVESDRGDRVRLVFYRGEALVLGSEHCDVKADAEEITAVDSFGESFNFMGDSYDKGDPMLALMDGLGTRRAHPDARRLTGLGQLVLDPADPAVVAPFLLKAPLSYASGETTGAHSLIITTIGDTAVPVSGGVAVGRAAGLIDFLNPDPRYGKSANQVLIDTHTTEGVHTMKRYTDAAGNGIHYDVENFAAGTDTYKDVPRLDMPLRLGMDVDDGLGGRSAAIFPYNVPDGQHGFDLPGGMTDRAREQCAEACTEMGDDPCECSKLAPYDVGYFMMNMIGRYFSSSGTMLETDLCQSRNDCSYIPEPPAARDVDSLP